MDPGSLAPTKANMSRRVRNLSCTAVATVLVVLAVRAFLPPSPSPSSVADHHITENLAVAIEQYEYDVGSPPDKIADLMVRPSGEDKWKGPYTAMLTDQWGTALAYERESTNWHVRSAGPDRQFGTKDDVRDRSYLVHDSQPWLRELETERREAESRKMENHSKPQPHGTRP
jgi:hypothetical protein